MRYKSDNVKRSEMPISIGQEVLRGLARTVAEIEWMLLVLVLLYQAFGGPRDDARIALNMALMFFGAFVLAFRYTNLYRAESRVKIAIEVWMMIVFIAWALSYTGRLASPLINCYLLVIITSALTLGKWSTAAVVAVIGATLLFLASGPIGIVSPTMEDASAVAVKFAPFMIVAYFTSMFSADIHYGLFKTKMLSETDELTGLLNRRAFAVLAGRMFGQAARYRRSMGVLMIDSDGLKQVNDQHGHAAGDEMLRQVARCIQHEFRTTDVLARYGGDEFVALLPETEAGRTREVAERVRRAVENARVQVGNASLRTTVSIGIASYPEDGRSLDLLMSNADAALYRAKNTGRNVIVEFSASTLAAS